MSDLAHAKPTTTRKPKLTYSCATITRTRNSVRVLDRNYLSESDRRQEAQSTRTPKLVPIQVTLTPVQWYADVIYGVDERDRCVYNYHSYNPQGLASN